MRIHEIDETEKNKQKSLKKIAYFIPILILLHVAKSSVIQFDKYIHPVVPYKFCLICIFTKIHENLTTSIYDEGNQVKTTKI